MTIRVYEHRSTWISRFLNQYHVNFQRVSPEQLGSLSRRNIAAAVEIDGHVMVDPNEDALRKVLHVG